MPAFSAKHQRQSIRLRGYDYSLPGIYFITIGTYEKQLIFGKIFEEKLFNSSGHQIYECNDRATILKSQWVELGNRYACVIFDSFSVMPDHVHGIMRIIAERNWSDGAELRDSIGAEQSNKTGAAQKNYTSAERNNNTRVEQRNRTGAEQSPAPTKRCLR